jgi:sulfhydrogenase subunit beta (sulfur reductase)
MLEKVLAKSNFNEFVTSLGEYGDLIAPVKTSEKVHSFKEIESLTDIDLSYVRTMIPPKKFFINPEEVIFEFNIDEEVYTEPLRGDETIVLLGVHSCDINALNLLARVFTEELPDKYYLERKERAFIVGVSCVPDEYCFCHSTGTSHAQEGFELFLHDIGDSYFVRVGSLKGHEFIETHPYLFEAAEQGHYEAFKEAERKMHASFTRELEMTGLQDLLDMAYESEVWTEYGDKCLGCGSCNLVCPRCRCYDVQDHINLDMNTGERVRIWYSRLGSRRPQL